MTNRSWVEGEGEEERERRGGGRGKEGEGVVKGSKKIRSRKWSERRGKRDDRNEEGKMEKWRNHKKRRRRGGQNKKPSGTSITAEGIPWNHQLLTAMGSLGSQQSAHSHTELVSFGFNFGINSNLSKHNFVGSHLWIRCQAGSGMATYRALMVGAGGGLRIVRYAIQNYSHFRHV
jgi:hypothetical protein